MRFVQILNDRAHWIFEADTKPLFADNIVIIDITDKPEVQEGFDYNSETGEFTEPEYVEPKPEEPTMEEKTLSNTEQIIEDNITLMMAKADSFEQQTAIQADQFTIMDAIADLYEQIATLKGGE